MSTCSHTWRLPGQTREVQCRMDDGHGGQFHLCGQFVTPVMPSLSSLHDIAPLGRRGAFRDTLRPGRFR